MTMDDGRFLQPTWHVEAKEHFCAWLLQLLMMERDDTSQPLQAALTHFLHSDAVYQASENFLATLAALWQVHYPDHPPLVLPQIEPLAVPLPTDWHSTSVEEQQDSFVQVLDACDTLTRVCVPAAEIALSCELPSAAVGVPYRARVQFLPRARAGLQVLAVEIPPETGLHFNVHTGECFGLPMRSGQFNFSVHWQANETAVEVSYGMMEIRPVALQSPQQRVLTASTTVLEDLDQGRLIGASVRGQAALYAQEPCAEEIAAGYLATEGWQVLVTCRAGMHPPKIAEQHLATTICRLCRETLLQALAQNTQLVGALAAWEAQPLTGTRILKQVLYRLFVTAAQESLAALERSGEASIGAAQSLSLAVCHRDARGTFVASFYLGDGVIAVLHGVGKVSLMSVPTSLGLQRGLNHEALQDSHDLWQRVQFGRFQDAKAVLLLGAGTVAPYFVRAADIYHTEYWLAFGQQVCPLLTANNPFPALVDWLGRYTPHFESDRSLVAFLPQ